MELFFNTPKLNWLLYSDPIKNPGEKTLEIWTEYI